jgi:hypothetical protein
MEILRMKTRNGAAQNGEKTSMSIEEVTDLTFAFAKKYLRKEPEAIVSAEKLEGEWRITIEALERRSIPDSQDLLGRYEVRLNKNGALIGWAQKVIRRRCDLISPSETQTETS